MKVTILGREFDNNPQVNLEKIERGDIIEGISLRLTGPQSYPVYTELNILDPLDISVDTGTNVVNISGFQVDNVLYMANEESVRINGSKRISPETVEEEV